MKHFLVSRSHTSTEGTWCLSVEANQLRYRVTRSNWQGFSREQRVSYQALPPQRVALEKLATLSPAERDALVKVVLRTGFLTAKEPPSTGFCYPRTIHVEWGDKKKDLHRYRERPAHAFVEVEKALIGLATRYFGKDFVP